MPTPAFFSYVERLHQLVLAQADDLQPALNRITESSPPASPAARDYNTVRQSVRNGDRQALWGQVQLNCTHVAVNVADHVRSLATLLAQPNNHVPIYAHTSLARVAIEGAALVAYIHDPGAPFELRFARGIAFLISDADLARKAADRVPGNAYMAAPGPRVTQHFKDLLAVVERAKIEITLNKKSERKGVRLSATEPEALINVAMTDLVTERFPKMPAIYAIASGVAHSMPHRLNDNATVTGRCAEWEANPLDVGGSALAAMNAAHTILAAHAWHRGRGDDPSIAAANDRIAAVDAEMSRFARKYLPRPRLAPVAQFLQSS